MPETQEQRICPVCERPIREGEGILVDNQLCHEECTRRCADCGRLMREDDDDILEFEGQYYCENCYGACTCCGEATPYTHMTAIGGDGSGTLYCDACREENCSYCERCETWESDDNISQVRVHNGNDETDYHEENWCDECREDRGVTDWDDENDCFHYYPGGCERIVISPRNITWPTGGQMDHNRIFKQYLDREAIQQRCPQCMNEEEPCARCQETRAKAKKKEELTLWIYDTQHCCYHDHDHNRFKSLIYRTPHEHPYLYYGIELEVLFGDNANKTKVVHDFIVATEGLFVSEYDRSVDMLGNGAEFISRPLSYKAWNSPKVHQLLEKGVKILTDAGAKIEQNKGCGLHVHMSLNFFEHNTKKKVQDIKDDMDWFFQVFQPEIEKISGRKYTQYCVSKSAKIKERITPMIRHDMGINVEFNIKKGNLPNSIVNHDNHHYAVVQTAKTIEVRTFKSTLDINTILATIQFCRAIAHAARNITITEKTTFGDIINCKEGPELTELVRKLKINTNKKFSNTLEVK